MSARVLEWNEPEKNCICKSYSHQNTGDGILLVEMQTCGLAVFPKETPSQMFFYENCEVLQNIIFTEECWVTVSDFL